MNRFHKVKSKEEPEQQPKAQPLREFTKAESADGDSGSSRRSARKAFWLLLFFLFILLIAGGTYAFMHFSGPDEVEQDEAELAALPDFSDDVEVPQLLDAHLNALGGRQALEALRSIRYEGKVNFPSAGQSNFTMLLLRPDKGMLAINPGSPGEQRFFLNGNVAWLAVEQREGGRVILPLDEEATKALRWSMRIDNSLRRMAMDGDYRGFSVKTTEHNNRPCFKLTKTMPDGSDLVAILDRETLYLLKIEETLAVGNETHRFGAHFDDYRMVSGVVEPYRSMLYKDGELDNEVEINSVQMNAGVISSLFQIPDELTQ